MAKTEVVNIRISPETKAQVESLFSQFGISISDAVNIFFHQSIMIGGMPFRIQLPKPNAETIMAMEDVINNTNMSRSYDDWNEMMKDLNA